MKIKLYVIELSPRQKWALGALLLPTLLLGVGTLASAAVTHNWQSGEVLQAADLNQAFANLDQRLTSVEQPPTYAVATTTTPFTTSSFSFQDLTGLSVNITTDGRPVLVTANLNVNPIAPGYIGVATVTRDGTNLGASSWGLQIAVGTDSQNIPANITFVDTPAAGAHTYKVQVRNADTSGTVTFGEVGVKQQLAAIQLR
jgi:hypothetical protein